MDSISSHQNLKLRDLIVLQRSLSAGCRRNWDDWFSVDCTGLCVNNVPLAGTFACYVVTNPRHQRERFGQTLQLSTVLGETQSQHLVLAAVVGILNMFSLHKCHTGKPLLDEPLPDAENEQFLCDFQVYIHTSLITLAAVCLAILWVKSLNRQGVIAHQSENNVLSAFFFFFGQKLRSQTVIW